MTTKKPAVTTQLKTAKAEVEALKATVIELHKKVEQEKSSKDYYSKQADKANNELTNLHDLLDVLDGALPKKKDGDYGGEHPAMTRLASWLANRKVG